MKNLNVIPLLMAIIIISILIAFFSVIMPAANIPPYRIISDGRMYCVQERFFSGYTTAFTTTNKELAIASFNDFNSKFNARYVKHDWKVITDSNNTNILK